MFSDIDRSLLFMPETPILALIVRDTLAYLTLFLLICLILQRESGTIKITNLLVIVLIADAVQNAMADD